MAQVARQVLVPAPNSAGIVKNAKRGAERIRGFPSGAITGYKRAPLLHCSQLNVRCPGGTIARWRRASSSPTTLSTSIFGLSSSDPWASSTGTSARARSTPSTRQSLRLRPRALPAAKPCSACCRSSSGRCCSSSRSSTSSFYCAPTTTAKAAPSRSWRSVSPWQSAVRPCSWGSASRVPRSSTAMP